MHLHGFFYEVFSRGTLLKDTVYKPENRRTVVTEFMLRRSTMVMEWVPTRPGNWIFHCHLSFHVAPDIRLPRAPEARDEHHAVHMAGLVVGIPDLIAVEQLQEVGLSGIEAPGQKGPTSDAGEHEETESRLVPSVGDPDPGLGRQFGADT